MIDLSFLTEAEQEAILKVLNRDAELKKSEDQRVKNLHDVVHDENEFKYKSGQWFYDAKSKRHREKIHGVDLVRASIRKRKKPATIAEQSELNKESSKRRWVNSVNQDLFIPPELFGVMEAPDEAEEDIMVKKQEGNQSSKKVGFTPEKEQDNLRNGTFSPPKARQNPFNSEGLQDNTDYNNEGPSLNPKNVQMNGTEKPKTDKEPLYAVVNKTPAASSPSQAQDFDMDDALMEPRFHGQRGKTQNIYLNEKPLVFGKSFSGEGKVTMESSYPSKKHRESYSLSSEEERSPERARISKTSPSNMVNKPVAITKDADDPVESVALWRQPFKLESQEPRQPSPELSKEQKTDVKARDLFGKTYSENPPTSKIAFGEISKETDHKPIVLQNRYDAKRKPIGLTANLVQNVLEPSKTSGQPDSLLHQNKDRKDLPRSSHFNVMSLKDRMNEMPREQMSNPSQFQSVKHFWNVEEKNMPRETTVTSPDKILMHVSSRNKPTRSDIRQRSSEMPTDKVLLLNTPDNLSEEEQTSQKVASWLAQTPTVYVDGQMDQNEDQLSSGKEIVEQGQRSAIPKKSDDDFTNARQKLREEALQAPKITETKKYKTDEIQMMSQGEPDLGYHKQTTITFSPISQNYKERQAPTTDLKMTDRGFYSRVIQMSNKQSPEKEMLHVEPKNEPYEEKSPRESRIGFEMLNNGISDEEVREEPSLPKEESEAEEIIEKSAVPRSRDQQDFILALKKLEIEASKQPSFLDFEVKDQGEEITQNTVTPVKSSIKIGVKHFSSASDANELEMPTDQAEEIIEKSAVPKSRDQQDFILALKKLEIEASKKPLPDFETDYQDELPKEEMTQNTVTPVKSSFKSGFEHSSSANNEFETPTDHSVKFQPQRSYASKKESVTVPSDMEEIIEKSTVPSKKDNEDLSIALRKLELEAIEQESDEYAGINQGVEFGKPESQLALQTNSKDHSDLNYPYLRSNDGKSVDDLEQPPKVSLYGLKSPSRLDTFDGKGKLPVSEEPIEKNSVESQESSVDFHNRLMRLEEQAKIPEVPEDLLVDDTVKVSQFPNREVVISKKVFSSIESMPSIENFSESGKAKEVDSSWNRPKDIHDPKSLDYSHYEKLANYPHSPEPSGSYTGNGNLPYKKPEVGSPEVSNSKPGKPALSESPSDTSSSKNDKYEFMVTKAQDESISKVLDWFSRSSEIGDNPLPPVGMLQPSKGTSSQILIQTGGNKKESGPNEKNFKTVSEPTSYLESPNTAGKERSRLSILGTQSGDNSDIPNVKLPATVSLVEDNGVPSGLIEFSSENESSVQYGNGGGGSGKILNQEASAMQENGQCQEAKYLDISAGKEGFGTEVHKDTLEQGNQIPVVSEFMSNQIPEMFEKPHSGSSLSSTDTNNDQSDINELLTKANGIENASPPRVINSNLEVGNCLEFGKSGSGSGKTFLPSQEVSEIKEPRLSLSSTDTNDDQLDIKNGQHLTQANSIENAFPPRVMNSNLEAGNCLEFGKNGGGSGKISSPSQVISKVMKPMLSLSSTDSDDDQSGIMNDELLTQTTKENISPPRLNNLNVEADNCLEYGTSGGGSGKTSSPSQEISNVKKPRLSLSSTDTDDDQSGIKNDELLAQTTKENISPPRLINLNVEADNCLEYGTSGGGSGKTFSPSQEISNVKKPRLSLSGTDTDDDQSGIKNDELLAQTTKKNISPPRLINLNLEADDCLEYGTSGGGSDKPVSPNQDIPEVRKPRLSLSSTDRTNHDPSETGNVDLLTPVHVMEEESVPPVKMYPVENPLDLGKSKSEAGTMSNQAADYMQTDPQLKEVGKEVFEGEKESNFLKEEPQIQKVVEAETLKMDTENRPLDGSQPENVEYIKILEVPTSHDTVNFNVHQRKVSDIKQLWEGDKSALPAAKTSLSSSKQMLSPSERSITKQRSSIESDDRSSPSLVTFKRVMVEEEEENALLPVDQLKSFWENEKNKEVVNAKQLDVSLVKNGGLDADEVSALAESRSKFKKRHTFHSFFEKEHTTSTDENPPSRSVSLSEGTIDNLKERQKSTTFQNLRSFWNVDHKANPNDRALSDAKNRQFRSNPDLSKVSFVARIKSKLESQSLEDIREDTPDTYQVQPVKDVYDHKNKTPPLLNTFTGQKSSDNSLRNSVEAQEKVSVFQDCNPIEFTSVSEDQTQSKSSFEVPDHKKEVSEVVVKSEQRTEKLNEFSLRLQKLRNMFSDKSLEGTTSVNYEYKPKNDEMATRDVENQNLAVNKNGEGMTHKECERRQTLVKQIGLDENSPVGTEAFYFLKNSNGRDNLKNVQTQVDNGEQVYETVERTLIPPPKHSADFHRGLQKLYNESLAVAPVSEVKPSQNEFMNIQSPEENFSKVLTVSSSKIKSNVQRASSKERSSSFQQPIVINLSSTKMIVDNEDTGKHGVNLDAETETSITKDNDLTPAEKKEIVEKIEMPKVVPRAPFNYFDEGLKKLYDESRDLTATKPVSGSLQTLPAKEDLVMYESVTSVSQAPDILEQEIGETIGKASAPTKMYHAKSSEKDQKEDVNDEEEPFMENVPSNHVTSEESQQRFSEHIVAESTVTEMSPKGKEAFVQENVQSLQYETIQESPSETDSSFTDMRQSSPIKEKSNSLRKSTLELYLEVPYRREMSKSMDFELGGYIASDVDIDGYQLNSSSPTEDIPVNSFPQNAETLKRLSQSVPAFINDDTDGRDTDSASESSFQIGRHKKSPSSLTNLSGSSGMASMSSVSGSVMSIYSGDFGNVDIKGGIEFSIDYVEQLKEFLIYVYQCRELAVAEPKKQRSDPYVKAYLLPEKAKMGKRKTAVKKKTLNPVYNEILRYKIPKQSLLAQALNLSVWHHDALGRNSFLGEVNVNLGMWDWSDTQRKWYPLEARTPAAGIGLENRGEMKLSLKYVPMSSSASGSKPNLTGEVHISIKDCLQLPMLRENKINSFVKCTVLPDTSRKSRQRTRTVDKTPNPYFNHTMVYDGFKEEDLREACVELTVWDHNRLSNHFLGGIRIGLGTGKSYGTPVDWMDSTPEEAIMWEKMMASPNTWIDGMLPLRMFKMAKLAK